jgi:hypothetical protein
MEQVLVELQTTNKILSSIAQIGQAGQAANVAQPQVQEIAKTVQMAAAQAQQAAADPLARTVTNGSGQLTEDALMALIEPHLENITIKTGLQGVLQAMGIPRLPEARPDQYQELYNRFTAVIQQHSPHGATGSII